MISPQITLPPKTKRHLNARATVRLLEMSAVFLILGACNMKAVVINATNVSLSAVQTAVNSAKPGDTVDVPSGTAVWTGTLTINSDIQLIGAGIGNTVIFDGGSPNAIQLISFTTSPNHFDRVSGFTFQGTNNTEEYSGTVRISGTCHAFRLDHCEFNQLNNYDVWFAGWVYGVVDHSIFYNNDTGAGVEVKMDAYGGGAYGDGSWADQDNWGTTNALYFENDVFTNNYDPGAGAVDCCDGARFVFRYNYVTNADLASHGTETSGRERSVRLAECYENNFYWNPTSARPLDPWAIYLRGGTAVIFSNTITGGYEYPVALAAYRQWINNWSPWGYNNAWDGVSPVNPIDSNSPSFLASGTATSATTSDLIDTTKNWTANQWVGYWLWNSNANVASAISGNTANTLSVVQGYNAVSGANDAGGGNMTFTVGQTYLIFSNVATIDQPGRGQGDLMADTVPGNGIPYDTVTGKTNWPNESLDPVYDWDNTMNFQEPNNPNGNYAVSQSASVVANRDWYDGISRPGYTPLPYPHPLDTTNGVSSLPTFALTVINGAGGSNYTNGAIVSISADAPGTVENAAFTNWSGPDIANTNQANTTVTMPGSNLTVRANYVPYPPSSIQALPAP